MPRRSCGIGLTPRWISSRSPPARWRALGVVFLAAIIEAVAVLGILVPGTPILMAVAGAAAIAGQPMLPFLALSILGAVIGDFLSFWVGKRFSRRLRGVWPFLASRPTLMENAEAVSSTATGRLQRRAVPVRAGFALDRAAGRRHGGNAPAPLRAGQRDVRLRMGAAAYLPRSTGRVVDRPAAGRRLAVSRTLGSRPVGRLRRRLGGSPRG